MSKFKTWLQSSRIIHMDTIKGDFARDIVTDPNFPDEDDRQIIYKYIEHQLLKNGTSDALPEFKALYSYFLKQTMKD